MNSYFIMFLFSPGLCGVYDANKNNDMAMPVSGSQAKKVSHFIKGWRWVLYSANFAMEQQILQILQMTWFSFSKLLYSLYTPHNELLRIVINFHPIISQSVSPFFFWSTSHGMLPTAKILNVYHYFLSAASSFWFIMLFNFVSLSGFVIYACSSV